MRSFLSGLKPANSNNTLASLLRFLTILRGIPVRSTMSTQSFQLRFNPLTGESDWVVINEVEKDKEGEKDASRSLLANTSYLDMLNDSYRNRAYRRAIEAAITGPCHVIDIGYHFSHCMNVLLRCAPERVKEVIGGEEREEGKNKYFNLAPSRVV